MVGEHAVCFTINRVPKIFFQEFLGCQHFQQKPFKFFLLSFEAGGSGDLYGGVRLGARRVMDRLRPSP